MSAGKLRGCSLLMLTVLVSIAFAEDPGVREPQTVWCLAVDADPDRQGGSDVTGDSSRPEWIDAKAFDSSTDSPLVDKPSVGSTDLPESIESAEPPHVEVDLEAELTQRRPQTRSGDSESRRKYRVNAIRDFADERFQSESSRIATLPPTELDADSLEPLDTPLADDTSGSDSEEFDFGAEYSADDLYSEQDNGSASARSVQQIDLSAVFTKSPRPVERQPSTIDAGLRDPVYGKKEQTTYPWTARVLAHRTLYFEDMPLERYGRSAGPVLQPVKSGVRFFADTLTAPLQFLHERPCHLHYVLPLDRPGNGSPNLRQPVVPYVPQ